MATLCVDMILERQNDSGFERCVAESDAKSRVLDAGPREKFATDVDLHNF